MKKLGISIVIGLISIFLVTPFSYACVGARPLAMGGAFTGLADDANATYWNPAALGLMERAEVTYTGTVYDRDVINYDDWASVVIPLKIFSEDINLGTLGLSFMNNIDKTKYQLVYYWLNYTAKAELTQRWYTLSYGRELKELVEGLCIGANLRYATLDYNLKESLTVDSTTYTADSSDDDSWFGLDLSMYYLWQGLSVGFLFQDVNEPDFTIFGTTYSYGANFRPGIAYRFNDRYILTAELYDAFDNVDSRNFRIGAEAQVTDNIAIRLGGYDITATEKTGRAITGGLGLASGELIENVDLELSYAIMYWYESEAETEDKLTHFLSLTVKF